MVGYRAIVISASYTYASFFAIYLPDQLSVSVGSCGTEFDGQKVVVIGRLEGDQEITGSNRVKGLPLRRTEHPYINPNWQ